MNKLATTMSRAPKQRASVVEASRRPPLWTVKAGGRFHAGFTGQKARARAIAYAEENFHDFEVVDGTPALSPIAGARTVIRLKTAGEARSA